MAPRRMIVSDLLCYAITKLQRVEKQPLKSAMLDFYTPGCILEAKELLLNEADLVMPEKWAKPAKHRLASVGQNNLGKEIEDIFAVIQAVDEAQLTDKLPLFVSDNPDNMPSVRLTDGEMAAVLLKLSKLESIVMNANKSIEILSQTVRGISTQNSAQVPLFLQSPRGNARGGRGGFRGRPPGPSPYPGDRDPPTTESTDDESGARAERRGGEGASHHQSTWGRSARGGRGGFSNPMEFPPLPGHREPAAIMQSSGQQSVARGEGHEGGGNALQGEGAGGGGAWGGRSENQIGGNWGDEVGEEDQFTLEESRRKRHHPSTSPPSTQQPISYSGIAAAQASNAVARRGAETPRRDVTAQHRHANSATGNRRGTTRLPAVPSVVGKGSSLVLKAADDRSNEPKKAVFCVSNVNRCYNCDDIVNYCIESGVVVSKCFDVTPLNQNRYSKCFRITGLERDRDKILDENFWPSRVNVRPWVHRGEGGSSEGQYQDMHTEHGLRRDSQPAGTDQQPSDMDIGSLALHDNITVHKSADQPCPSSQTDSVPNGAVSAPNQFIQPDLSAVDRDTPQLSDILQAANDVLHGES